MVSRDELREEVWGYGYDSGSTVVETFMSSLRKKVDRGSAPLIRTVRGFGYRLVLPTLVSLRSRLAVVAAVLLSVLAVAGSLLVREVDSSQLQLADQQLASVVQAMGRLGVGTGQALEPAKLGAAQDALSGTYVATLSGGARHVVIAPSGSSYGAPRAPTVVVPARSSWQHASTVGPCLVRAAGAPCWYEPPGLVGRAPDGGLALGHRCDGAARLTGRARHRRRGRGRDGGRGLWVSRLGLRPIAEVTQVADAIVAGDRSRRVAAARPGTEAGRLARAFNLMLDEQQALEARLRQFIADASTSCGPR